MAGYVKNLPDRMDIIRAYSTEYVKYTVLEDQVHSVCNKICLRSFDLKDRSMLLTHIKSIFDVAFPSNGPQVSTFDRNEHAQRLFEIEQRVLFIRHQVAQMHTLKEELEATATGYNELKEAMDLMTLDSMRE